MILDDEYFMRAALTEAKKAFEADEIPIGAVIVCSKQIIARAHNMTEKLNDVTAHAEMLAFTSASNFLNSKYLHECTLYVTIEPCLMCAGASYWTQIPRIVCGARDEKKGFSNHGNFILHPKCEITYGILESECAALMRDYFKSKRE